MASLRPLEDQTLVEECQARGEIATDPAAKRLLFDRILDRCYYYDTETKIGARQ